MTTFSNGFGAAFSIELIFWFIGICEMALVFVPVILCAMFLISKLRHIMN